MTKTPLEASQQGRVLHLSLNRPEKRNALNIQLCRALVEAFAQANADPSIGAILLSGSGPVFCAGMDLKEVLEKEVLEKQEALEKGDENLADIHERLFSSIDRARKPIVAAVQGAAIGGGMGLVANTHIAIASPDAKFGLTEIKLGLWPVMIFPAIVLAIGERRATELSVTGRFFGAAEAHQYGLVAEISANPLERAHAVAAEIAAYRANAMALGLSYSRRIRNLPWKEAGDAGRKTRGELMAHPDFAKGVAAFFRSGKR